MSSQQQQSSGGGVTVKTEEAAESSKDPVQRLADILNDPGLSEDNKTALIKLSQQRFRYRRSMAQKSLWALVLQLPVLYFGGLVGVTLSVETSTQVTWLNGFLAGIVAAYFGTTAWRPSS